LVSESNRRSSCVMVWFGDSTEGDKQLPHDQPRSFSGSMDGGGYKDFRKRLHEEILRSQRCTHTFTLMRVNVDNVPETPPKGFQDVLKSAIREYDLLCVMKPTEYFFAFPETNEKNAELIADRIRHRVSNQRWLEGTMSLRANIGIACFPHDGTNTEDLLLSAEQDLKNRPRS
jgi:hypothetical protein